MTALELDQIGKKIVNAAFTVHKRLGPGLLEKVYEVCLAHEIRKAGLEVKRQMPIPIIYDELNFKEGFRLDLLVEENVIIEIKAVELLNPLWEAQILSHLKMSNKHLGYLINFNVPLIKHGIKRFVSKGYHELSMQ
jgi:GxxExxY protein